MKNSAKLFKIVCVLGVIAMIFAACTPIAPVETEVPEEEQATVTYLRFYFPVGVAGALAPKMDALVAEFNAANENIQVEPIFTGSYPETFQKALTAHNGGNPPDVALFTDADVWSMKDAGALLPLDELIEAEGGEEVFFADFHEAFVADVKFDGQVWGLPFQKSTPVFYWNKDIFEAAGLDPDTPPTTWDELVDFANQLTIRADDGSVTRWGVEIPIDAWLLSAFAFQNGMEEVGNGTEVYLDDPRMVEALAFLSDLANVEEVMPQKRLFGDSGADFVAEQTAMVYNSTGSLTFIRESATFDFGVAYLPGNERLAVPTGGGPLVILNNIPDANKAAAWEFIKWMTSPEISARWTVETGYVPVRKSAVETAILSAFIAEVPQVQVAINQLEYAVPQPPRTHDGRRIFEIMTTAFEDAMFDVGEPADLLANAQQEAETTLARFE